MSTRRHLPTWLGFSAVMAISAAMPDSARAQYGLGAGWGWGIFGVQPSPSTQMLNQHALNRAGGGVRSSRSHSAHVGNPNSYVNRIRDNGFVSHYDAQRRRAPSYQSGQSTSTANRVQEGTRQASSPSATAAIVPLVRFFDASLRLVWPQESPFDGELRDRRDLSDQASLAVLKEKQQRGVASITSATEARQKLLDYGRPALQQLRAVATTPIADSFHRFLLSLYDSLEASTWPPDAATVSPR
jgi:hypothetical protein